jgi:predicted nucleic acid-binding protein
MPKRFLDTNIYLYAAAQQEFAADVGKHDIARDLIREGGFGVSAQVMQEFYVNAVKLKPQPLPVDEALEWLAFMARMPCVAVDSDLVVEGVAMSRQYQLSYWDGAIVAAAHVCGATILYTEDLNHGQMYGAIQAINPFKNLRN